MPTVTIRLDPAALQNPDADIRYVLPDLIAERSGGTVRADGYDYDDADVMTIFLDVDSRADATALVCAVLKTETVLGNDLESVARVGVQATAKVSRVLNSLPHFARVTVIVGTDDGDLSVDAQAYAEWKEGASIGARYALRSAAVRRDVVVTDIAGLLTDTNASIVALACARAVWEAAGVEPPAEAERAIEAVAFASWDDGAPRLPDLP